jgi:hypothetical protein
MNSKDFLSYHGLLTLLAAIAIWAGLVAIHDKLTPSTIAVAVCSGAFALYAIITLHTSPTSQEIDQSARLAETAHKTLKSEDFSEEYTNEVNLLAERMRTVLSKVDSQTARIYKVGVGLAILSAFAPLLSIAVYVYAPAVSEEDVKRVTNKDGSIPTNVDIVLEKDWRILLWGGSLGASFLAGATFILSIHRKQYSQSIAVANHVNRLDAIATIVRLRQSADRSGITPEMEKLFEDTIPLLLAQERIARKRKHEPAMDIRTISAIASKVLSNQATDTDRKTLGRLAARYSPNDE